jgi:hypothetical protein
MKYIFTLLLIAGGINIAPAQKSKRAPVIITDEFKKLIETNK